MGFARGRVAPVDLDLPGPNGISWNRAKRYWKTLTRGVNIWLWLCVVLPTTVAAVYFFLIASDLYMSEARFVVRTSAGVSDSSSLSRLLHGNGFAKAPDNASIVEDFITSRSAFRQLEASSDLRAVVNRPEGDFITRFPNFFTGSSFEALYKHALGYIDVTTSDDTGVTTLKVKAYRPEDAKAITQALVTASEQLINRLNIREENDTVQSSVAEVDRAEKKLADIEQKLTAFRFAQGMLDPKDTSKNIYDSYNQLMATRMSTQTRLAELLEQAPNNPSIPDLKSRVVQLDKQIAQVSSEISGDSRSVAGKASDYERLSVARDVAVKEVSTANEALSAARVEAGRQHLYVEHIAEPDLPDYPLYPRRIISFVVVSVGCFVAYGIAWLLIAGIREHEAS
jgi:capsular polysaccharide transport system permease protein